MFDDEFISDTLYDGIEAAQVSDREFYACTFRNCRLSEMQWTACVFENCVFEGCDLTRAQFVRAQMRGVRFIRCKLMGIDWSEAGRNPELHFEHCNLRYASFTGLNLRTLRFLSCELNESNFIECALNEADFSGSQLDGSTIRRCELAFTDFRQATGVHFDPAQNKAKDARIPLETAITLALAQGMRVVGTASDEVRTKQRPAMAATAERKHVVKMPRGS